MKGFIEIVDKDGRKVIVAVSLIGIVGDFKSHREIHFAGDVEKGIKTHESYEEICNKIRDAVKE